MRKKALSILMALLILTAVGVSPAAAQPDTVVIYIEGKKLVSDVNPVIRGNRTMVPLRAICEGLGLAVQWDEKNYFVMISSNESNLVAPPGEVGSPQSSIRIFFNGYQLKSDVAPLILNDRTMVPIRVISEEMGMKVDWNQEAYEVYINWPEPDSTREEPEQILDTNLPEVTPAQEEPLTPPVDEPLVNEADEGLNMEALIMGPAQASAEQMRSLLYKNNPQAPDLVDLYLEIGAKYGVRGDLAFCQAAHETGWWKFTGLVQPWQNNYCGLAATGIAATGEEDLNGADSSRVRYEAGVHGAIFTTPEDGVEAQIQHLYAYATRKPLPKGTTLVDPRFGKVNRGCAPKWVDLGGKWAVPGYDPKKYSSLEEALANQDTYGHKIIKFYAQMF